MTIINIQQDTINQIEKIFKMNVTISPTQMVRMALLHLAKSKLDDSDLFSLLGQTATDTILQKSLEEKIK